MGHVQRDGDKAIIEGVRPVTWKSGEMCEFASCLVSALGSLGEDVSYPYIMGTSGAAFRFTLNPGAWDFGNYAIQNVSPDPFEPVRRAFRAAGYACSIHVPEGDVTDEDAARIVGCIDRGVPVLATRVCGPSDCSILTGYDAGGEVLLGWSTYQYIKDDHIPTTRPPATRKPGWRGHIPDYTLIGERAPAAAGGSALDALRWGGRAARMPAMGDRVTGLRGLAAWAAEMRDDAAFPAGDEGAMAERYVSTTINITMLRDHCQAEPFLAQVAADAPDLAPEALQAAACYGRVARIRARMDDLIPDDFTERGIRGMYDPAVRRAFADEVLRILDAEAEAVGCLERLLARCG